MSKSPCPGVCTLNDSEWVWPSTPTPELAWAASSFSKLWKSPCIVSLTAPTWPLSPTFAPVSRALAFGVTSCTPESAETSARRRESPPEPSPRTRLASSGVSEGEGEGRGAGAGAAGDLEGSGDVAQHVARDRRAHAPEVGEIGGGLFRERELDELRRVGGVALQQLDRRLQAGLVRDELVDAGRESLEEELAAAVGEDFVQRLLDQLIGVDAGFGNRRLVENDAPLEAQDLGAGRSREREQSQRGENRRRASMGENG